MTRIPELNDILPKKWVTEDQPFQVYFTQNREGELNIDVSDKEPTFGTKYVARTIFELKALLEELHQHPALKGPFIDIDFEQCEEMQRVAIWIANWLLDYDHFVRLQPRM